MKRCLVYCAAVIAWLFCTMPSLAREWTDATGTHRVEAEYVSSKEGTVKLKLADGTFVNVPLERLSEPDRQHVAELIEQAEKEAAEAGLPPWTDLPAPRKVMKYDRPDVHWISYSPDGRFLACNSESMGIELWDIQAQRIVRAFRHAFPGREVAFAFSPDGRTIVAARGGIFMSWDVTTGKLLLNDNSLEAKSPLVFSPDGKWLAAGAFDGQTGQRFLQIIDTATMKRVQSRPMLESPYASASIAFSPDSKRLALGVNTSKPGSYRDNADGSYSFDPVAFIQVLGVPSLKPVMKLPQLKDNDGDLIIVTGFTADDRRLVGYGHVWLVYDANTGRRIPSAPNSPRNDPSVIHQQTELITIRDVIEMGKFQDDRLVVWRPGYDEYVVRWKNVPLIPDRKTWPEGVRGLPRVEAIDAQERHLAVLDRIAKEIRIYDLPQR